MYGARILRPMYLMTGVNDIIAYSMTYPSQRSPVSAKILISWLLVLRLT